MIGTNIPVILHKNKMFHVNINNKKKIEYKYKAWLVLV